LTVFVAATQEQDDDCAVAAAVDPVSCSDMDSQFDDALTYGNRIAKISSFNLPQSNTNTRRSNLVADGR